MERAHGAKNYPYSSLSRMITKGESMGRLCKPLMSGVSDVELYSSEVSTPAHLGDWNERLLAVINNLGGGLLFPALAPGETRFLHRGDTPGDDNVHNAFGGGVFSSAGVQAGIDHATQAAALNATVISAAPFASLFEQVGLPFQGTVVQGSALSFMQSDDGRNVANANGGGLLTSRQDGNFGFVPDIGILQSISFAEVFTHGVSTVEQIQLTIRNTPDALTAWSNVFAPQLLALFDERARADVLAFRGVDASGLPTQLAALEVFPGSDAHGVDTLPDTFQLTASVDGAPSDP